MSGETYQRPRDFPDWVDSTEDEALVAEALAFDSSVPFLLNSKANCEKFVTTKRNLSAQSQGKYIPNELLFFDRITNFCAISLSSLYTLVVVTSNPLLLRLY